jgi:hypothetical protein
MARERKTVGSGAPVNLTRELGAGRKRPQHTLGSVVVVIGRPSKDVQTSLRLPTATYAALSEAAKEHGWGIGEEIRLRLDDALALGLKGQEERRFPEAAVEAARHIKRAYGAWHENPFAFEVFKTAISTLLAYYRPKGEPVAPSPEPGSVAETFFGSNASSETAGKAVAMAALAAGGMLKEGK